MSIKNIYLAFLFAKSSSISATISSGFVFGPYRLNGVPSWSTKNFAKFHLGIESEWWAWRESNHTHTHTHMFAKTLVTCWTLTECLLFRLQMVIFLSKRSTPHVYLCHLHAPFQTKWIYPLRRSCYQRNPRSLRGSPLRCITTIFNQWECIFNNKNHHHFMHIQIILYLQALEHRIDCTEKPKSLIPAYWNYHTSC